MAGNATDSERAWGSPGSTGGVPQTGTMGGGRWFRILILVVVAGLALRLVFVLRTRGVPLVEQLIGDAAGYLVWAREIAGGAWVGSEGFYQAPLYPYAVGVCLWVFGDSVLGMRTVQAVWGAVGVLCLAYAVRGLFGARVGVVTAALLALYAPAIFFDGIIQKATLGCLLICVLLLLVTVYGRSRRWWLLAPLGVVLGLLILTRENAIIWVPIVALWVWAQAVGWPRGRRIGAVGLFVLGVLIAVGPVAVRNVLVCGEWSISTFQAGPNFYIGNSAEADGRYRPLIRGHETPEFERRDATVLAEAAMGRTLSPREVSRYWVRRAIEDMGCEPARSLRLLGVKMLMVWNRYEVSDVESLYIYEDFSPELRVLRRLWHFGVLCPLAAIGISITWRDWRRLWIYYALIVSMACSVALFYVMARYRFPLVPLLMPFAGAGCVFGWDAVRKRDYRYLVWPLVVAVAAAVVANFPVHDERRLDAMARMNLGVALARDGRVADATEQFRRAVSDHPGSAEAHNNLAQALAVQGEYGATIPHYEAALAIEPGLVGVDYNFGVALERVGRIEEALSHYEQATRLDPTDQDALRAVERLRGVKSAE